MSWWGFLGELKRYKWILHFSCVVDFSHPSLDPFTGVAYCYTFAFCHLHGQWCIVGIRLYLTRTREVSIGFYLVHTNCHCRIKNNIAWVSILLFNDTKIIAPDNKIFLVNLYHEPVKQVFSCLFIFFTFLFFSCIKLIVLPQCVSIN